MRRLRPFVALLIAYLMTPIPPVLTENIGGLIASGHAAHALEDAEHHQKKTPERCCSGPMHVCGCHDSANGLVPVAAAIAPSTAPEERVFLGPDEIQAEGHLRGVFRPPNA
jgi:hypothetical protein